MTKRAHPKIIDYFSFYIN